MGFISRSQTWHDGRQQKARLEAFASPDEVDKGGLESVLDYHGLHQPTKLQKIVEENEGSGGCEMSLDCKDIVRLMQVTCGDSEASSQLVKAAKVLVDFCRHQQGIIASLRTQNEALRETSALQLHNEEAKKEVHRLTQCSLRISFAKLSALLGEAGPRVKAPCSKGEVAQSARKVCSAMEEVLALVEGTVMGTPSAAATGFGAPEAAMALGDCNIAGQGEDQEPCVLCHTPNGNACAAGSVVCEGDEGDRLLPLGPRKDPFVPAPRSLLRGLSRPWKNLAKKLRKAAKSCFRPEGVEEASSGHKAEARLRDCRDALRDLRESVGRSLSDFQGPSEAGNLEGPDQDLAVEMSSVTGLLSKTEAYTTDVLDRAMDDCSSLAGKLERQRGLERELLSRLNELNLRLLSSENKACQVAMEMLLM